MARAFPLCLTDRIAAAFQRAVLALLCAVMMAAPGQAANSAHTRLISSGMPSGFESLAQSQRAVVDFYFGGRPIGQSEVEFSPGHLKLLHPDAILAAIPGGVNNGSLVLDALSAANLPTHSDLICGATASLGCPRLNPDVAGIVFNQARFRADLYVNPRYLNIRPATDEVYIAPPKGSLSLVDTVGGALAGGDGSPMVYNVRNRMVVGSGSGRLIGESSLSSAREPSFDTLVGQLDRPDRRYSAGLFYIPGIDVIGRRRIIGAGVESQFDTRTDKALISGSVIVVFLGQRSRVDLFAGGHLLASHIYEAGNQTVDTSSLPEGSYPIEIHIQEVGGASRIENRFFTKNPRIPPPKKTIFFAHAGVLARDREHAILSPSKTPLIDAGVARRFGDHLAWDTTIMAAGKKVIAESGANVMTSKVQGRLAVLGSTDGDYGFIGQASSMSASRLSWNFDLRHIASHNNKPLLPLDDSGRNPFISSSSDLQNAQLAAGSYTQIVANVAYRLAHAHIGVAGFYRRDVGRQTSYAIGPTVTVPIIHRQSMNLTFDGSLSQSDRGRSMAFGLRLQLLRQRSSISGSIGAQSPSPDGQKGIGGVAELAGSIQRSNVLGGDFTGVLGVQHASNSNLVQAEVDQRGPAGLVSGNIVHRMGPNGNSATQYGFNLQTTIGAGNGARVLGSREQTDSIIQVSVNGTAKSNEFEVLVDDATRGRIHTGGRLTIAVTPYRRYTVRIRPVGGDLVAYDSRPRTITVYPGTAAGTAWTADPVVAMFGRLVWPDGHPVAGAQIFTDGAVSETDDRGYFQIQAPAQTTVSVRAADGTMCRVMLNAARSTTGYSPLGALICQGKPELHMVGPVTKPTETASRE